MHIKILGYNIFQKGGTTRSNLNLIQSFLRARSSSDICQLYAFSSASSESIES